MGTFNPIRLKVMAIFEILDVLYTRKREIEEQLQQLKMARNFVRQKIKSYPPVTLPLGCQPVEFNSILSDIDRIEECLLAAQANINFLLDI